MRKVALIKLAAMGDVALACRALSDFGARHEVALDLHWIVDHKLEPLARALTRRTPAPSGTRIEFHAVDATALFQGGFARRTTEAVRLFGIVARLRPSHLVLLHRDWRYAALLRPAFTGELIRVSREPLHELDAYARALEALGDPTHANPRAPVSDAAIQPGASDRRIGILVGGAQNQKMTYAEKRWPRMRELVERLAETPRTTIALFGGPEDMATAAALIVGLPKQARIENLVGKIALDDLPAELAGLDAFVSIDSGLAHVASTVMRARHQRVITLFGPTDPAVWGPRPSGNASAQVIYLAKACSPCYANDGDFRPCRFHGAEFQHCMTDIRVEDVMSALTGAAETPRPPSA